MSRQIRLSDAQVYTLRRMNKGTRYFMRGDMSRGEEDRGSHRVKCPSLPVLFREGLVNWCNSGCRKFDGLYYSVELTPDGKKCAIAAQTRKGARVMTTTQTISRERLEHYSALPAQPFCDGAEVFMYEVRKMARMLLAALDSEPVAYSLRFRNMAGVLNEHINTNTTFDDRETAEAYGKGGSYVMCSDGSMNWVLDASLDAEVVPLYAAPPAPVAAPDERYQHLSELYHAQEKRLFKLAQRLKGLSFDKYAYSPSQAIDVLETAIFGEKEEDESSCRAAMLAPGVMYDPVAATTGSATMQSFGNSEQLVSQRYTLPDGWKLVPVEPTEDMCFAPDIRVGNCLWDGQQSLADMHECKEIYKAMLAAAPAPEQEV